MSSFKLAAVLSFCLLVSSCGFQPLYGDNAAGKEAAAASYSQIEIASIPDRNGQYLRNQLIDKLNLKGRPADAPYLLTLSPLKAVLTNLGIRKDATATRAMLQFNTKMTLTDKATKTVLLTRDLRTVGGYNELDNQFATLESKQSVTDHMLEELSDTVVTQISLYFSRTPDMAQAVRDAQAAAKKHPNPPAPEQKPWGITPDINSKDNETVVTP